jgi:drug/metabolite transporter (DMT)-like permease
LFLILEDRRYSILAFVLLILFWGSTFSAIKIGLGYAPPVLFAGMRTLLCGVVIVLAALVWGGKMNLRRDWWVYLLLAVLNAAFFMGLQVLTIFYMPSGSAAVMIYLQPILVGLLAFLILGEPLSATKIVGLFLGFCGIVAVSAGSLFGSGLGTPLGVAFGVGSAVFWALGTVYFKKYGERISTLWSVALPFTLGGVFLVGLALVLEPLSEISWNGTFVASLLYAALVGTASAWVLWFGLVSVGEASRVSAYVFFVPLVSILIGALLLGETLSLSLLIGAALVISGIYLVNKPSAVSRQQSAKNAGAGH